MGIPRNCLIGQRFGKLVIINWADKGLWLCKCDCDEQKKVFVKTEKLKSGNTKSCGCYRASIPKDKWYKGCGELNGTLWCHITTDAKRRGIPFEITIEFAWNLYLRQEGRCDISGVPIKFKTTPKDYNTASLDRIDNTKGYTENNVCWVHKDINRMKNVHTLAYFIDMCEKVAECQSTRRRNSNE